MSEQADGQTPVPKELSGKIGKYEIVRPLGKGAMGMVYRARDPLLEREVALKVMMASIADDEELQKRFEREARAVGKMTHPNVVMVFDLGYHTDGSPYIAMELLQGDDLQKTLKKEEMTLDRKVAIIIQVLAGLSHAHAAGIVHRDIKPANIFIKTDGSVKIMDFGVARLTTASMTGTGAIVGTADYMSPEQVKGARVDGRSDVFSVGCMLYELLAGNRPFKAENLMAIFYRITHEEPKWDALPKGPGYDALLPILQKALAKNLDDRYQSAQEFAIDLREYLKKHVTSATGRHALENLGELEAPSGEASGDAATIVEEDLDQATVVTGEGEDPTLRGTAATARGTRPPTAATVMSRPGTRPRTAATRVRPVPQTIAPSSGSPVLYSVLGGMGVLLVVLGGFIYWTQFRPKTDDGGAPPTTIAENTPTTTAPTPPPATAPPPTTAPPPPTVSAEGKAAATVRSAQASFSRGDYDRAVSQAQEALRIDPANDGARSVLQNAQKGQQAKQRFAAAQAALNAKDYDKALSEAQAGSNLAPWDGQGPDLVQKARAAEQRAAQQAEEQRRAALKAEVDGLLKRAEDSLQGKQYDAAIAIYDEALSRDPGNSRATQGRTAAVAAKAVADATVSAGSGGGGARGRSFVLGKTVAEAKKQGAVPPGFQATEGVQAQSTQSAATPGRLEIRIRPAEVKAGDQFAVEIEMVNEGAAPIQLRDMIVTTTVNGRRSQGPIQPQVKEVAPRQSAQLYSLSGNYWREDTESWSMQVMVRTTTGATYRNTIEWK